MTSRSMLSPSDRVCMTLVAMCSCLLMLAGTESGSSTSSFLTDPMVPNTWIPSLSPRLELGSASTASTSSFSARRLMTV